MSHQSEVKLENNLIKQLLGLGYASVKVMDGDVISCIDRGIKDNVDDIAITAYSLTSEELSKMELSNINTIRYEIDYPICGPVNFWEGVYSASNKGDSNIDFTRIISGFYRE